MNQKTSEALGRLKTNITQLEGLGLGAAKQMRKDLEAVEAALGAAPDMAAIRQTLLGARGALDAALGRLEGGAAAPSSKRTVRRMPQSSDSPAGGLTHVGGRPDARPAPATPAVAPQAKL